MEGLENGRERAQGEVSHLPAGEGGMDMACWGTGDRRPHDQIRLPPGSAARPPCCEPTRTWDRPLMSDDMIPTRAPAPFSPGPPDIPEEAVFIMSARKYPLDLLDTT